MTEYIPGEPEIPDESDFQLLKPEQRIQVYDLMSEAAEARADDLRRQLRETNSRADDVDDLAEYVREERSLRQQEAERERRRREASILRRAKWWITGDRQPTATRYKTQ